MLFRMIYDDRLAHAAYLVGCQRTGDAIIIDPSRDVDRYLRLAEREGLAVTAVAETHIHADFLSGARELVSHGATAYLSGEGGDDWSYRWPSESPYVVVRNGDTFDVGGIQFECVHTPGHTPEHLSYLVTDRGGGATEPMGIASGDFVFVGALGRPDLLETAAGITGTKEDSARDLHSSAQRFAALPEHLQVWPAHGSGSACGKALGAVPQSTVGYEKRFNPSLALIGDESKFVAAILEGQPAPPPYFKRMKFENRDGPALLGALPTAPLTEMKELAATRDDVILDMRPWESFRAGHLPGSLHCPLTNAFPTIAGSYVEPDQAIWLVGESTQADEAVRELVRVGLDRIAGCFEPWDVEAHGGLSTLEEIEVGALAERMRRSDAFILDVRQPWEHETAAIAGAVNVPHTRLALHLDELPRDQPVYAHCRSGIRSSYASSLLARAGFHVTNVRGGMIAWQEAGLPTTSETAAVELP